MLFARHQELELSYNCALEGPGLEVLPRCCPSLKALHLKHLPNLADCFLPALQQSEVSRLACMARDRSAT